MEDLAFVLADALLGYASEHGSVDRYISQQKFDAVLMELKKANPERYEKEIQPFVDVLHHAFDERNPRL